MVSHLAHIGQQILVGKRRHRHGIGVEQVLGLGGVPVEGNVESAVEGREVQSHVEGVLGLPLQVGVVIALDGKGGGVGAVDRCHAVRAIESQRSVGVDGILITGDTVSGAQLQIVNPLDILQEVFLREHPGSRCRWEPAPLMPAAELRRAVGTEIGGEDVFVSEHIVDAGHIGAQGVFLRVGLHVAPGDVGAGLEIVVIEVVGLKALGLLRVGEGLVFLPLHDSHSVYGRGGIL